MLSLLFYRYILCSYAGDIFVEVLVPFVLNNYCPAVRLLK